MALLYDVLLIMGDLALTEKPAVNITFLFLLLMLTPQKEAPAIILPHKTIKQAFYHI